MHIKFFALFTTILDQARGRLKSLTGLVWCRAGRMGRGRGGAGSSRPASVHVDDFEGKGMPQLKSAVAAKTPTPPKQPPPPGGPPPMAARPTPPVSKPAPPSGPPPASPAPVITPKVTSCSRPQCQGRHMHDQLLATVMKGPVTSHPAS